uniref:Uncharacterized protein n=1 Tax=Strigamia maritima TaxID=126957 RepID=T1JIZ7_STRMM
MGWINTSHTVAEPSRERKEDLNSIRRSPIETDLFSSVPK